MATKNTLLPKMVTIGEFEKKTLLVPDRTFIDEDTKVLLMQQASDFSLFRNLHIEREFFTFLKNSRFLFSFFEELAVERVTIDDLTLADTYANYQEHLEILSKLRENYTALLDKHNYVDKMTLPEHYRLNTRYLSTFERIDLYLEGYLNRFKVELFTKVSQTVPLFIHLHANRFNQKMIDLFNNIGFSLAIGHNYTLDLTNRNITAQSPIQTPATCYTTYAAESRIEEVAWIKKKIYDFTQKGYAPEEIVILLPNSSTQKLLDLFDDENNFNFAMGFPFTDTAIYKKLDALYRYYMEKSFENSYRLKRLGFEKEQIDQLQKSWQKQLSPDECIEYFTALVAHEESESYQLFEKELALFGKLLPTLSHYPFYKVLHLFLNRLGKLTLDDVRGGKVTVMEILETRGIEKEAVIIVDFNEGTVPAPSAKDLFLSSSIRSHAGLPTPADRQNLQKYYYKRFFDRAKDVAICYIEDEQNHLSRFYEELEIEGYKERFTNLNTILFNPHATKKHYDQQDLILPYDFTKRALSATALKIFLTCRRRYYFQYIAKFEPFEIPKEEEDERTIGNILHDALREVYADKEAIFDEEELLLLLQRALYKRSEKSLTLRFLIDNWLQRLHPFVKNEIERFNEGYRIHALEAEKTVTVCGLQLKGIIDRIDKKENRIFILDYKSGKIPSTTKGKLPDTSDFQLQFYYLLTKTDTDRPETYYYDLANGTLQNEKLFDEKLDLLYAHLEMLQQKEFNFTMTEKLDDCKWCPYQKICNRIR
jgi:RecB family exonuclease